MVLGLLLVTFITALVTAQLMALQKNSRHSYFVNDLRKLRQIAESGVNQSIHELGYGVGLGDGKIGTENWLRSHDLGRDGKLGTGDEGEQDGIPTPGEPHLSPTPVGPSSDGIALLTIATDSAWDGVKRIVSTAYDSTALATVEVYVRVAPLSVPGVSMLYIEPEVVLDLPSHAFKVSGFDTNPDGTVGPAGKVYGIATSVGDPPGSNASAFTAQVPSKSEDQILGLGTNPSIGEVKDVDFNALFNGFKNSQKTVVEPGTYANVGWGDYQANDYRVTYSKGDLHLSGTGKGAGVLLLEGSLFMSGSFTFVGMILVKGDVQVTGGGNGVHLYGSAMIGQTLTAGEPSTDLKVTGTADLLYSSKALAKVSGLLPPSLTVLYWNDLK
jgi:hypothetical protein